MILYYIRHGDPIYNPDSLTELGHRQAEALAERTALYGLDEIYCSTSTRAIMTSEPTCKRLGKTPVLLDWANEGRAWENFALPTEQGYSTWCFVQPKWIDRMNHPEVRALGDKWYDHPFFAETKFKTGVLSIDEATDNFMRSLGYEHDRTLKGYKAIAPSEKRVALFAHQGMSLSFLSSLLDIPYPYYATHFDISHSCVTAILFENRDGLIYPKVLQHSNDSHLFKANLMNGYHGSMKI
ncbi:MAG: histidine phosphatase family protein [Clostridia bacterium]|nr:histidine phosphatase family protein [Clostridia bacterium]